MEGETSGSGGGTTRKQWTQEEDDTVRQLVVEHAARGDVRLLRLCDPLHLRGVGSRGHLRAVRASAVRERRRPSWSQGERYRGRRRATTRARSSRRAGRRALSQVVRGRAQSRAAQVAESRHRSQTSPSGDRRPGWARWQSPLRENRQAAIYGQPACAAGPCGVRWPHRRHPALDYVVQCDSWRRIAPCRRGW